MMNEHTAKAFDGDLQELTRKVAEMGGLAEREIADSIQALTRRDVDLAKRVVATDPTIDALQQEIEEKAVLTIARRQPMAVDLREIVAALRVSNDLERIGDLAAEVREGVDGPRHLGFHRTAHLQHAGRDAAEFGVELGRDVFVVHRVFLAGQPKRQVM